MFAIDHAATALLIKRRYPSVPLTPILVSVQAMELAWVGFNYLGIERTTTEASVRSVADAERIKAAVPGMNPAVTYLLDEITTPETWDRIGAQVFKVNAGERANESYLIYHRAVYPIGQSFGGTGFSLDNAGNYIIATADSLEKVTPAGAASLIANAPSGSQFIDVAIDATGNYIVTAFLGGSIPTGSYSNGAARFWTRPI